MTVGAQPMKLALPVPPRVGRYRVFEPLASGGMATVYLGWLEADEGFVRPVAIKVMHPNAVPDEHASAMMLNEARIASRIRHANVVPVIDLVSGELGPVLVLEYVAGVSLSQLLRGSREIPAEIVARIVVDGLEGLHAAHHARSEAGLPLEVIHRDVSPQNILLDETGVSRITDFGVAKAIERAYSTASGEVRGKIAYMAPEQLAGGPVDARADVWGMGMVLWHMLSGVRPFADVELGRAMHEILAGQVAPPSSVRPCADGVERVCMRALTLDRDQRFASAREMAVAVERACPPASHRAVSEWLRRALRAELEVRAARVAEMERLALRERKRGAAPRVEATVEPSSIDGGGDEETHREPLPSRGKRLPLLLLGAALAAAIGAAALRSRSPEAPSHVASPASPAADSGAVAVAVDANAIVAEAVASITTPAGTSSPSRAPSAPTAPRSTEPTVVPRRAPSRPPRDRPETGRSTKAPASAHPPGTATGLRVNERN